METKELKDCAADLWEAARMLHDGQVVGIPTETVYGLAADARNPQAVAQVFAAKGRPADNPLIVHIASMEQLTEIAAEVPPLAKRLAEQFWPGPLTMILPKQASIPEITSGGLDTVGIRMPSHPVARALIRLSGVPIAAPSANISGYPSPTTAAHVMRDMQGKIAAVVDGGPCTVGVESTVISLEGADTVRILRPGYVTKEMLESVATHVSLDPAILHQLKEGQTVRSPGMKYKHYAPKVDMILIEGDNEKMSSSIKKILHKYENEGKKVGLLVSDEVANELNHQNTFSYGSQENLAQIASEIYEGLRYFDDKDVDIILAQGTTDKGIGLAIMNRLHKASGFNSIFI